MDLNYFQNTSDYINQLIINDLNKENQKNDNNYNDYLTLNDLAKIYPHNNKKHSFIGFLKNILEYKNERAYTYNIIPNSNDPLYNSNIINVRSFKDRSFNISIILNGKIVHIASYDNIDNTKFKLQNDTKYSFDYILNDLYTQSKYLYEGIVGAIKQNDSFILSYNRIRYVYNSNKNELTIITNNGKQCAKKYIFVNDSYFIEEKENENNQK